MLFDKIIRNSFSPVRKDSTYISLEYVINDLGIFCKGEQRTKDIGYAMSPIGVPLGLAAVPSGDYAAKSLGRIVILWHKVTDVQEDNDKNAIIVSGNANDKIIIQCEPADKAQLLSRIASMREFCPATAEADEKAAAWMSWAIDKNIENPFAPLDELIENERATIESRSYSESQLESTKLPEEAVAAKDRLCPKCGATAKDIAKFCTQCGIRL